jgi:endogenous inhibitor of DNA gyrase (YacG/DUF329 family)
VPVPTCPICGKPAPRRPQNPEAPFCSRRCRLIDLHKWMGEAYRVPGEPGESEDEVPPEPTDPEHDA